MGGNKVKKGLYITEITKALADKIGCEYSDNMPPVCCAYFDETGVSHVQMCIDVSDNTYKTFIPIPDAFPDANGKMVEITSETEKELNQYLLQQIQNIKEFDINKLKKLSVKDVVVDDNIDRIYTTLILDDYDWMNYQLDIKIPTAYDIINISFQFYGTVTSTMNIQYKDLERNVEFDTDIFIKHLKIYMQHHMQQWETEGTVFYGEKEALDFFNEVIDSI